MIKFIDLYNEKGYVFDGLWKDNQQNGYIFWFPNEQSINLTYTMPICIYTDIDEPLNLSIEDNDIFSFITHDIEDTNSGGFRFKTPLYTSTYTTIPEAIDDKFLHVFYVSCKSNQSVEAICKLNIDNHGFIKIGADFYCEYEPTYVNLSNFGIELPDYVQKAMYDSNVHEDYKDNILINRKFKELLSNYWDVIANKGSYKSLLNSLDWFEWGNNLRLREIWKYNNGNQFFFDDKEMCSLLEDKYIASLGNFVKTTYFSIYAALYTDTNEYDSEHNPVLQKVVYKWSKDDLSLKISLLAQFFETFFMPIHASILHGCVEDIVYTNTIKTVLGTTSSRIDSFNDNSYVKCNVSNGSVFKITNVSAQVTNDTVYAIRYNDLVDKIEDGKIANDDIDYFGVDYFGNNGYVSSNENSIKSFAIQYYTGPGVIIPIKFTIANESNVDFIKYTKVNVVVDDTKRYYDFSDVIYPNGNKYEVSFNYLVKETGNFEMQFMFVTGASRTLTKTIKFTVTDVDNLHLQMYKVKSKDDRCGLTYADFNDFSCNDYFFRIQPNTGTADMLYNDHCYTQYLPYMTPDNPLYDKYNGIKLTRTVIFGLLDADGNYLYDENTINYIRRWMSTYLEFYRVVNGKIAYLIYVSKKFNAKLPWMIKRKKFNIIRNSLGFYSQFHYVEKMDGNTLDDFTVSQYDAVCCDVEVSNTSKKQSEKFKYGHLINSSEWLFRNSTTLNEVKHPTSVRQPFVANSYSNNFVDGYYDIVFKYNLSGQDNELSLCSAFRKKSI